MRFDDSLNEVLPMADLENQRKKTIKATTTVTHIDNTDGNGGNKREDPTQDGYMYQIDLNENNENELGHNALIAYQISKGVKYSTIVAFFMNLALVLFNSYYVFFALCALWGYYITLQYKPSFALSYFVYLLINMVVRTSISIYDCVNQFNDGDTVYGGLNVTWTILLFVMSVYGIRMAWRLHFYLTVCSPEEQIQLRNIRHLNLKALCW